MTAARLYLVWCDGPECLSQSKPEAVDTAGEVRATLRAAGWVVGAPGRRYQAPRDFCPEHAEYGRQLLAARRAELKRAGRL